MSSGRLAGGDLGVSLKFVSIRKMMALGATPVAYIALQYRPMGPE
jgi:hypothetical protein